MRVSQLLHVMDRDDEIVIDDMDAPVYRMRIYSGTVRGIYKDSPINKMRVISVCADDGQMSILVIKQREKK